MEPVAGQETEAGNTPETTVESGTPPGGGVTPYDQDQRAAYVAELAAKHQRRRQADIEGREFTEDTPEDELPPATDDGAPAPDGQAFLPEKVKAVVDGKEVEFERDKVVEAGVRALQKEGSADEKLRQAEATLAEANRIKAETAAARDPAGLRDVLPAGQPAAADARPPSAPAEEPKLPDFDAISHRFQFGDAEESKAALKEFWDAIQASRPAGQKPYSQEELDALVEAKVEGKDKSRRYAEIFDQFNKSPEEGGFSDIYGDPDLLARTTRRVKEMLRDGSPDTWDTYRKAGDETREWHRPGAGVGEPPKDTGNVPGGKGPTLEEKDRRKRTIISLRPASGAQPMTTTATPKPKTRSEVIADIRKARGQEVA